MALLSFPTCVGPSQLIQCRNDDKICSNLWQKVASPPPLNELISRLCTSWKWLDLSDCSVNQKYDPVMAKWHDTGINRFWFELTWSQSLQETLLAVTTFITQGCFAAERVSPYLVLCRYVAGTFRLGLKCSVLFGETDDLKCLSCLCKSFGSHQRSHINVISSGIPAAGRWINETSPSTSAQHSDAILGISVGFSIWGKSGENWCSLRGNGALRPSEGIWYQTVILMCLSRIQAVEKSDAGLHFSNSDAL